MAINSRLLKVRIPQATQEAIGTFKYYALDPPYINYWKSEYKTAPPETKLLLIALIQIYEHSSKSLKSQATSTLQRI